MRAFKLAAMAAVCSAFAACATTCILSNGVQYIGVTQELGTVHESWTCEVMEAEMRASIDTLDKLAHRDERFSRNATWYQDLRGWQLTIHPTADLQSKVNGNWYHGYWEGGQIVAGHTDCVLKRIHVGGGWTPRQSAFVHEMAHVLQRCHAKTGAQSVGEDYWHTGWHDIGLFDAIEIHKQGF